MTMNSTVSVLVDRLEEFVFDVRNQFGKMIREIEVVPTEFAHRELCRGALGPRSDLFGCGDLVVVGR